MRYVIGICIVTGFLIWDFGYNEGRYITYTVMELKRLTAPWWARKYVTVDLGARADPKDASREHGA